MAVTRDKAAPYAPASAIIDIMGRYRSRGLPLPINAEVLGRAGVSASLIPRTLYALPALDLIDEGGAPTSIFDSLRLAPESDTKQIRGNSSDITYEHEAVIFWHPRTSIL